MIQLNDWYHPVRILRTKYSWSLWTYDCYDILWHFNIGQLLVIPHPAVPVAMYLFGLNF